MDVFKKNKGDVFVISISQYILLWIYPNAFRNPTKLLSTVLPMSFKEELWAPFKLAAC